METCDDSDGQTVIIAIVYKHCSGRALAQRHGVAVAVLRLRSLPCRCGAAEWLG